MKCFREITTALYRLLAKSNSSRYWRFSRGQQRMTPKLSHFDGNKCSQMDTVLKSICKIVALLKFESLCFWHLCSWDFNLFKWVEHLVLKLDCADFNLDVPPYLHSYNSDPVKFHSVCLCTIRLTGSDQIKLNCLISRPDAPTLWLWHFSKYSPCLWKTA